MREILFKGKTFGKDVWVEGGCVQVSEGTFILVERENGMFWATPVIPETVCQFTGLFDSTKFEDATEKQKKYAYYLAKINNTTPEYEWKGVRIFEWDYNSDYDVVTWCNDKNGWSMSIYDFPTKQFIECHCYKCNGDSEISDVLCDFKVVGNINDKTE